MNHTITPQSHLSPLLPSLQSLVTSLGGPADCDRFELEDTVLRAGGYAWDIGADAAAPLHAEIERLTAEKEAAEEAARNAPPTKESLRERIAQRRWEEETKGVTVDLGAGRSLPLMTDATSQAKLTGLMVVASAQPIAVSWKGSDGSFLDITNADVPAMVGAVFSHVQVCFAREAELLEALAAAEDTAAFAEIVDAFWPQ